MFTQGTCLKKELYGKIKELMIGAGWENISSDPTNDFDVMYSTGEAGDKKLVVQMRATAINGLNSIEDTNFATASLRLIGSYTPGTAGKAGTVDRTSETWRALAIAPIATTATVDKETQVIYRYDVNKNRIIFNIEYPLALNLSTTTFYIGIPDDTYCSEPNSRGLLFVTSTSAPGALSVLVTDSAGEVAPVTTATSRSVLCQLSPKNPNSAGSYTLSEIFYGDSSEGIRGKLSGIYALPTQNVLTGDIIVQGTQQYLIVVNQNLGNDAFPSKALALPLGPVS